MSILLEAKEWLTVNEVIKYVALYFPEWAPTKAEIYKLFDEGILTSYVETSELRQFVRVTNPHEYMSWFRRYTGFYLKGSLPDLVRFSPSYRDPENLISVTPGLYFPLAKVGTDFFSVLFEELTYFLEEGWKYGLKEEINVDNTSELKRHALSKLSTFVPIFVGLDDMHPRDFWVPAFVTRSEQEEIYSELDECSSFYLDIFLDGILVKKADIEKIVSRVSARKRGEKVPEITYKTYENSIDPNALDSQVNNTESNPEKENIQGDKPSKRDIDPKTKNKLLSLVRALAQGLVPDLDEIIETPHKAATAIDLALSRKGIELPVSKDALANYLSEANK